MASKKAMVIGAKGMDGSHMCDLLASKDYQVYEITRKDSLETIAAYAPQVDEIYNFAGVSDVINPFENVMAVHNDTLIPLTVLEAIKGTKVRFFQAGSILMWERDTPYAAGKEYAYNLVNAYRSRYGLYVVNGIMYPHTSERQKDHFFPQKICKAAANRTVIYVDRLDFIHRDYGYAPDYMEAAWMTLQDHQSPHGTNADIATGNVIHLREFVSYAFQLEGLNYNDYLIEDPMKTRYVRDFMEPRLTLIRDAVGWRPKHTVYDTIKIMVDHAKAL